MSAQPAQPTVESLEECLRQLRSRLAIHPESADYYQRQIKRREMELRRLLGQGTDDDVILRCRLCRFSLPLWSIDAQGNRREGWAALRDHVTDAHPEFALALEEALSAWDRGVGSDADAGGSGL